MARIKLPQHAHMTKEELEAPTRRQSALPTELREPHSKPVPSQSPATTTAKVPKAKIDAILKKQQQESGDAFAFTKDEHPSGLRPTITEADIERYERDERRARETVPAPPTATSDDDANRK